MRWEEGLGGGAGRGSRSDTAFAVRGRRVHDTLSVSKCEVLRPRTCGKGRQAARRRGNRGAAEAASGPGRVPVPGLGSEAALRSRDVRSERPEKS